jgi:hypothetical protein
VQVISDLTRLRTLQCFHRCSWRRSHSLFKATRRVRETKIDSAMVTGTWAAQIWIEISKSKSGTMSDADASLKTTKMAMRWNLSREENQCPLSPLLLLSRLNSVCKLYLISELVERILLDLNRISSRRKKIKDQKQSEQVQPTTASLAKQPKCKNSTYVSNSSKLSDRNSSLNNSKWSKPS